MLNRVEHKAWCCLSVRLSHAWL